MVVQYPMEREQDGIIGTQLVLESILRRIMSINMMQMLVHSTQLRLKDVIIVGKELHQPLHFLILVGEIQLFAQI